VWFDPATVVWDSICGRVPGKQTNNRAELFAILRAILACEDEKRSLHIYTDSQYSIYTISMFFRRFLRTPVDESSLKVQNLDLIKRIAEGISEFHPRKVFLSKVKAHCGILGNEAADWLANAGREHGLPV
jgi:ribonuclease HI